MPVLDGDKYIQSVLIPCRTGFEASVLHLKGGIKDFVISTK